MRAGMTRQTIPTVPRCWKMLHRNRPSPGTEYAMSISKLFLNFSFCRGHDRERHRDRVFLHEALEVHERGQLAVDTADRVRADRQVEVGRLPLDRDLEQVVDVHERPPTVPGFGQE